MLSDNEGNPVAWTGDITPLVTLPIAGFTGPASRTGKTSRIYHVVRCRDCGDVTRLESNFTVYDAPLPEANLYRQRHLARHLEALSNEISDAAR